MSINQLNLGFPGETSTGNTMVAVVFCDQTITAPAGWTEFQAGSGGGIFYSASSHVATAAEILAGTTWRWTLGAFTSNVGFNMLNFTNVTGLSASLVTAFATPVSSMAAPSIAATPNELCFAFWIALNETDSRTPIIANNVGGGFARGGISHAVVAFPAAGGGSTGDLIATIDVASSGVGLQAAASGAGSHLVSISGGSLG